MKTPNIIYANPGDHGCGTWSEEKSEGDKKYYSEDLINNFNKCLMERFSDAASPSPAHFIYAAIIDEFKKEILHENVESMPKFEDFLRRDSDGLIIYEGESLFNGMKNFAEYRKSQQKEVLKDE